MGKECTHMLICEVDWEDFTPQRREAVPYFLAKGSHESGTWNISEHTAQERIFRLLRPENILPENIGEPVSKSGISLVEEDGRDEMLAA